MAGDPTRTAAVRATARALLTWPGELGEPSLDDIATDAGTFESVRSLAKQLIRIDELRAELAREDARVQAAMADACRALHAAHRER